MTVSVNVLGAILLLPLFEIVLLIYAGAWLGAPLTLALISVAAFTGSWLLRTRAPDNWAQLLRSVQQGKQLTGPELVEPMLVAAAALLLIIPGFITDVLGILFLFPPTRRYFSEMICQHWTFNNQATGEDVGTRVIEGEYHRDK